MRLVPLGNKQYAQVDDEDFWKCCQSSWYIHEDRNGYKTIRSRIKGRMWLISRFLMNDPNGLVDHHDNNFLNNQKTNLRIVTHSQNSQNRNSQKSSQTNYKGVSKDRDGTYRAIVVARGKRYFIGRFSVEKEAAEAYDREARIHHGHFARLNFPLEGEQQA